MNWYKQGKREIIKNLGTSIEKGLQDLEVENRLERYGKNELEEKAKESFLSKIIKQFSDFLILILIGAAIISMFVGEIRDSIVILAIVVINAFLGIYQEGKAEKALEALQKMTSPTAKVIRNGHIDVISTSYVVLFLLCANNKKREWIYRR